MSKPFVKGQLVRVPHKGDVIARIEHMGYTRNGKITTALVRHPLGKTEDWTWCEWMHQSKLRHVSAIDRLAEVVDEAR